MRGMLAFAHGPWTWYNEGVPNGGAGWCKGSTGDFGSPGLGSNPNPVAIRFQVKRAMNKQTSSTINSVVNETVQLGAAAD